MVDINFGETGEREKYIPDPIEIKAVPDSEDGSDDWIEGKSDERKKIARAYIKYCFERKRKRSKAK